jgi:clan AA aspartic protease (TIGR02281 family)
MLNQYPLNRWTKLSCALGVLVVLMFASPSHSAIYKWKDENGKTHFTDSLSKIPPQFRKKGELKTMKGAPPDPSNPVKLLHSKNQLDGYAIPVKPHGQGHFIVEVQINGNVKANLMVDTGATMVILSDRLGEALGVKDNKDLPTMSFDTAGGKVETPLFILESLKVGNAEVFGLEASTNPNFNKGVDGLLGMSFLGEFKLEMDRENSKMLLKPNAKQGDELWGGHSETWWKKKYGTYVGNMRGLRNYVNKYRMSAKQYHNSRKMIAHYSKLHEILDKRADEANLPKEYRLYP